MNLPTLNDSDLNGKKVLLRADLDVDPDAAEDSIRLQVLIPTLKLLADKKAKTILIGHRGRPEGKTDPNFSLNVISQKLTEMSGMTVSFVDDVLGEKAKSAVDNLGIAGFLMLENLRFDPGEESNDSNFCDRLSKLGEYYVNDAFSVSHRSHASIVGLPQRLPHAAGLRLMDEVNNLGKVFYNPQRPVVVVISGVKEDKLEYIEPFSQFADKILIGGRLPEFIEQKGENAFQNISEKLVVAQLLPDKEDITIHSVERFEKEISSAGTVVLAGPLGKFEEEGHRFGTERIFNAVANSGSFKIAGGGDTQKAVSLFRLGSKFNWISVGGGAMLDFLARGTLPGIEALLK